jgi:GLPGLI family protein
MRYVLFLCCLCLISRQGSLHAQSVSGLEVQYHCVFNHQYDRGSQPIPYFATLRTGEAGTYFYAVKDPNVDIPQNELEMNIDPDTLMRVRRYPTRDALLFGVITLSGKEVLYRDTLHAVQWTLSEEKRKIDDIECYKAVAFFRGRSYMAWYAPSIPVQEGPWKLSGLPGLVIEAYDDKRDLYFLAKSIKPLGSSEVFPNPVEVDKCPSFPDYITLWKNYLQRMKAAVSANADPNCLQCQTESQVKIYLWEKVLD